MKVLRVDATYVVASLSLLTLLSPYISNHTDEIIIHTDNRGLLKKIKTETINRPSMVLSDHIDIIYQIRYILKHTNLNIKIQYTQAIRPDAEVPPTLIEKIMYKMHRGAFTYYTTKYEIATPHNLPIQFPAQMICIYKNNWPVVTNIEIFLQESERKQDCEEYLYTRFEIPPPMIPQIDTYTLGRVMKRTPYYNFAYSKIIHSQLNTMTINKRWKLGSNICPVCNLEVEDWHHVLNCRSDDLTRTREDFIKIFRSAMKQNRTYPPLREFIIDCIRYPDFSTPPAPLIANPRYALLVETAFINQTQIGWPNFYRGLISIQWKKIQYQYFLELNYGDVHAVDKWARMLTKHILEFSRIMWNERCTIVAAERDASYDGRKRR